MKQTHSPVFSKIRLLVVLVGMACAAAHADDYSDVSQLVRAGKLPEALTRADQYLSTQPKDPQMRFIKGVIQRDSGKTAEAITTFTKLTENLGVFFANLASQAYNMALQLDTANPVVPTKLALIREIFGSGSAKVAHTAASSQQPAASTATPAVKPPVVAVAPVSPPVAVAPKPTAPTPTAPAVNAPLPTLTPTPPVATKAPVESASARATESASSAQVKEVEAAVGKWATAWSARDVKSYLAAYGKDFDPPGSMGRKAWEEERTQRILGKSAISVKVDKLVVSVNGNLASAKFGQDYKAGGPAVSSNKTLDFAKVGERWHIVKETVGN